MSYSSVNDRSGPVRPEKTSLVSSKDEELSRVNKVLAAVLGKIEPAALQEVV